MSDGCGPRPYEPFAIFGPGGACSRTRQASLPWEEESLSGGSSPRWPKQGTWDSGGAYELPTSGHRTDESGCSSLLRTPDVASGRRLGPVKLVGRTPSDPQVSLRDQVAALLPTPMTEPNTGNGHARNLGKEVRMLPTPTGRDHKGRNQRDDETCLPGAIGTLGDPMEPPFGAGRSSTDLPPNLWTFEDD
jgi:hypothetical protein